MASDIISPYVDIPLAQEPDESNARYGSEFLTDVKNLQVGFGSQVLRVDEQGLWLGAARFADAPFSVDMQGNIVASSLSLSDLSGTLDDIPNGSTYFRTTANQVFGAGYAYLGLNSSGAIIKGFLNSQLDSVSLPANGVRVDANGIYGRKSSSTTFYIDTSGNAYFVGDLASSTMTASTITGTVITGSTLTTASSGQRVVLTSTLAEFYNSSNTLIAQTYASSSSYLIKGSQSTSSIFLDAGSSGSISFLSNGTLMAVFNNSSADFSPYSSGGMSLGNIVSKWLDLWISGTFEYQAISQPVTYWGYVSGTSISPTNTSWSVSNPSTGRYTVTHSLGHTSYVVQVTPFATAVKNITIDGRGSSTFQVRIANLADTLENNDFMFTLYEAP